MAIVICPNCGAKNRIDENAPADARPVCGRCHAALTSYSAATPVEITDETFATTLKSAGDLPLLIDCWAPWCGPCRMLAPTLDQLAAESKGKYVIGKLNTDENPSTAARYQIDAIPCMLLFKEGKLVDKLVGLQPKNAIAARLAAV